MNSSRRSGTSLVEVLVVIVVFLVGILAIVQIFPGGFKALRMAQNNTIATSLGRAEIEMLKNHVDQMPDDIVPVQYVWNGSQFIIQAQPNRYPDDLGPGNYNGLDINGNLYDPGKNLIGGWQYLTGADIGRRVVGEGKIIPAPKQVGAFYGSLLMLQFAPVVYNPAYLSLFQVYGNDLFKHEGDPLAIGLSVRSTEYWISNEDTNDPIIEFPTDPYPGKPITFTLTVSYYTGNISGQVRIDVLNQPIAINPGDSGLVHLNAVLGPMTGIDYDSVKVERLYDDVSALANNDWGLGAGIPNPDPYQYKLLTPQRGLVLFNPSGYNYFVRRSGGRRDPLVGRVTYDVYDWRILNEEFVIPPTGQYRLAVNSVKVGGERGPDNTINQGIGVQAPDSTGTLNNVDVLIEDSNTGGIVMFQEKTIDPTKTSFIVNKSTGLITFLDADTNTPGLQVTEFLPGVAGGQNVTVDNRTLRALYMGKNEWAVQVMKPAAVYQEAWSSPGVTGFYLGGSVAGDGAVPSRIYFAPACAGRQISLGAIYYVNALGIEVGPVQLTARVETTPPDPALNLPYIDVQQYLPDFQAFDYAYPSAVTSVKGASVAVRVLWNPDSFTLTADAPTNMTNLDLWMQGWRRSTVETYLQRGY